MISKKDPKKYYKCIGQYCNENYVGDYDEVLFKLLETQKFFMKIGFKITQDIFVEICLFFPYEAIMSITPNDVKLTEGCFQGILYNQLLSVKQAKITLKYFKFVMTSNICKKILKHYRGTSWVPDPSGVFYIIPSKLKLRIKGLKLIEYIEKYDDTVFEFCEKHKIKTKMSNAV